MSYSLKTLLASVTFVAVLLAAGKILHHQYYLKKLNRFVERGDLCSVSELLRYAHDKHFPTDWADATLADAAKRGDWLTIDLFQYTASFDRKLDGERTPLMLAAANGHFNAVKLLLVQNVDRRIKDSRGATAHDIAMAANHPEIAALISAAEDETWNQVLLTERLIFEFMSDGGYNRDDIERLLHSQKYAALAALRTDEQLVEKETAWYRVSDRISIGTQESNGVEFIWKIDGMRINAVEYFYPPDFFKQTAAPTLPVPGTTGE